MQLHKIVFILCLGLISISETCFGITRGTFTDSSKPVQVKKGEDFLLAVGANPAEGYRWDVANPSGAPLLKFIGSNFQAKSDSMNQGGVEWFRFLALESGETEVCLQLRRPQEKDKPLVKEAKFKVVVS